MFDVESFVSECEAALGESQPVVAVKDVVDRAISSPDAVAAALATSPGVEVLHRSPQLTVATVIVPAGAPRTLPHDHRMWAVVGVYCGQEDNQFYRRVERGIDATGGRSVRPAESLAMGDDTIHAIHNPSAHTVLGAIHVYGGDLLAMPRSMWVDEDGDEEPYDDRKVIGARIRE